MDENSDPDIETARTAYRAAPDDREALTRYVRALGNSGKHQEALDVLDQKLTASSDDERALYLRANVLADMERYEDSVQAFKKSAERSPGYAIVYACWASVLLKMRRLDEAQEVLERGHQVDPKHPGILANLTALAGRAGEIDEVIRLGRQTIEVDPESPSAWDNLGIALHQKGDLFGAKEAFLKSISFASEAAETNYNLGRLLFEIGELDEASLRFRKAAVNEPTDIDALAYLARINLRSQNFEAAEADLIEILKRDPRSSWAHSKLARLAYDRGDANAMESHARQGIATKADASDLWEHLGIALGMKKEYPESIDAFRRAANLDPERKRVLLNLATSLADCGRRLEACAELERILASSPDPALRKDAEELLAELTHPGQ
jgi:tetratricopeptide (TPR) repeat protein